MKLPLGGTKVQYSTYSGFNVPSTIYLYIYLYFYFFYKKHLKSVLRVAVFRYIQPLKKSG